MKIITKQIISKIHVLANFCFYCKHFACLRFVLLFFFCCSLHAENSVTLGQLIRFDKFTNRGTISIDKKKYTNYIQKQQKKGISVKIHLQNAENETIAMFSVAKSQPQTTNKRTVSLEGTIQKLQGTLYVGLNANVVIPKTTTREYKDRTISYTKALLKKQQSQTPTGMVLVPQSAFLYGSNQKNSLHYTLPVKNDRTYQRNNPRAKFYTYLALPSFYIDQYEVSKKEFFLFLEETGTEKPLVWRYNPYDKRQTNIPVNKVSYKQALQYCKWKGKRLPTELEWEKTATGALKIIGYDREELPIYQVARKQYPTNTGEYNPTECNTRENSAKKLLTKEEMQTTTNSYNVFGLCGNAPEWTSSWLEPYRGNYFQSALFGKKYKVIRGGSFEWTKEKAKVYYRMFGGIPSLEKDYKAGFRCAKSVQ